MRWWTNPSDADRRARFGRRDPSDRERNGAMMLANAMIDWLLGLDHISWSDAGAVLSWRSGLEAWAWFLLFPGALLVAWIGYRRLRVPRWAEWTLPVIRAGTILCIVALLCGPTLLLRRDRLESGSTLCLVDRSRSLQIEDVTDPETDSLVSREEALLRSLERSAEIFGPSQLNRYGALP